MVEDQAFSNNDQTLTKDELTNQITHAIEAGDDAKLKEIVDSVHHADLADYLNFATEEQRNKILKVSGDKINPEILLEFELDVLRSIKRLFTKKKFSALVSKLDVQDVVSLINDLTQEEKNEILLYFPLGKKRATLTALSYPKDSAAAIMESKYVSVKVNDTVGQVLEYLIDNKNLPEGYDEIFILDKKDVPIGNLHISKLIRSKRSEKVKNIMNANLQLVDAVLDKEEVSYMFRHYDLDSAPVVDEHKRMIGVIYLDQIVDVIEEEAEEDIMKFVGINITDLYSAFFKTAIQRFPWLFFNLLTACLTSIVISQFKNQIEQLVILAAIMPIVGSMGGNAGTQSATIAVRAIANKDITTSNIVHVIFKEISACAMNGILLGILGGTILLILYGNANVCFVFALAVTINFVLAGLWGGMIPIIINRIGLDPAISSGVLLTFLTDFLGFFIFLGLATVLLL